jgi:diguanylate cyclase (GGDEF)-like protein
VPSLASFDTYRLRRAARDFYARALVGPAFYVLAWGLVLLASDYASRFGPIVIGPFVIFAGLYLSRYRHKVPPESASDADFTKWTRHHWRIVHLGSVLWGGIPAMVGALELVPTNVILVAVLAAVAFATAGSHTFATHPTHARVTLLIQFLPMILVFLSHAGLRTAGVTLAFYLAYLLINVRRTSAEYEHMVKTEVALVSSREEVAQLSLTDELTGLPNRRSYEVVWPQASSAAIRQKQPLAVLVLDLDHFKTINDRYGHLGGDACLKHFAGVLKQQLSRESDFIARFGGEEFIAVLPGMNALQAKEVAERVRAQLEASPCRFEASEIQLTVSVGVAAIEAPHAVDASVTFKRADEAVYAAKKNGRNRVELWTS